MIAEEIDYMTAIESLPRGASLVFPYTTWEDYEAVLKELEERSRFRVNYYKGKLTVMSPLPVHKEYKDTIFRLACVLAEELDIEMETRGSTTFRRKIKESGVEPDTCFYVQHAQNLIGQRTIDLDFDPPPDVVVEIDNTTDSENKFKIYAALGVPELWFYDKSEVHFFKLKNNSYIEIKKSIAFSLLTPYLLKDFIEQSKTTGQTAMLKAFRKRIKKELKSK